MAKSAAPITATEILLSDGVLLLGAALLFVIIFRRFGLGAVLGYLVAGALVGPQGLGLVGGGESKLAIAEIGIVLLLFLVGLELHPARLWRLKRDIFALGLAQVVLCGCEAHVCVLQTALGLQALGFQVFVVEDAVGARRQGDRSAALARLSQAGVTLVTLEMAA